MFQDMKLLQQKAKRKIKSKDSAVVSKQSKTRRVKKSQDDTATSIGRIWGLTVGIALGVFSYYHYQMTHTRSDSFPPVDTLDLGATLGGFTSNLCENVHVFTSRRSATFDAYLLEHEGEFDRHTRNQFDLSRRYTFSGLGGSHSQSFYLLEGSEVNARICIGNAPRMKFQAKALIFKGRSAYDAWGSDKTDLSSAWQVHELIFNNTCEASAPLQFSSEATDTNSYFFVVNVSLPDDLSGFLPVQVVYHLNSVRYDLAPAKRICQGQTSCLVPLDFGSSQDIVLKFGEDFISGYFLQSRCEKRTTYWLLMFLLIPAFIATSLSLCCCCCDCLDRQSKKKSVRSAPKDKKTESGKGNSNTDGIKTVAGGALKESTTVDIESSGLVVNAYPPGYDSITKY